MIEPCCGSRHKVEGEMVGVPQFGQERKAQQKELQMRADVQQQGAEMQVLKTVVEDLTSQFVKLEGRIQKIEQSNLRLVQDSGQTTQKLDSLSGRLRAVGQNVDDLGKSMQDLATPRVSTLEDQPPPAEHVQEDANIQTTGSLLGTQFMSDTQQQMNSLQAAMEELSAWRSKMNTEFESLQSKSREVNWYGDTCTDTCTGKSGGTEVRLVSPRQEAVTAEYPRTAQTPVDDAEHVDKAVRLDPDLETPVADDEERQVARNYTAASEATSAPYGRKLPPPGPKFTDEASIRKHFHLHREYIWSESVYDALFMVRLKFITPAHSALLIYGFCLNLCLVFFIVLNISNSKFASKPFSDTTDLGIWRDFEAHSFAATNALTGETLASRVCRADGALSVATAQKSSIEAIDLYLEDVAGFPGYSQRGRILCNIAMLAWYFHCGLELRMTANFLIAIFNLPRAEHTAVAVQAEGFSFVSLSFPRLCLGLAIATIRFTFAIFLLVYGTRWIAFEMDVVDLLLNASALAFVLDVDNTIFGITAPYRIVGLMRSLMPIRLPRSRKLIMVPGFLLVMKLVFLIFVNFVLLDTSIAAMEEARKIMCEPEFSLSTIVGQNSLGWVTYAKEQRTQRNDELTSHLGTIYKSLLNNESINDFSGQSYRLNSYQAVVHASSLSVGQLVVEAKYGCVNNNGLPRENPNLGARLWAITADESWLTVRTCEDERAMRMCTASGTVGVNIRFMCPCTCGCADIHAGMWTLARPENGCPSRQCMNKVSIVLGGSRASCGGIRLEPAPCKDFNLTSLQETGWADMLRRMVNRVDLTQQQYTNLSTMGCEGVKYFAVNERSTLCTMREPITSFGFAPFCPEACHCSTAIYYGLNSNCPGLCPKTCCAAQR